MLSKQAEDRLNEFQSRLERTNATSHHTPHDYDVAMRIFVDLFFKDGNVPHVDSVRRWAESKGWTESDARDLGEMADTVRGVMQYLKNQGRLAYL